MGSGTRYRRRKAKAERLAAILKEFDDEKANERAEMLAKKRLWVKGNPTNIYPLAKPNTPVSREYDPSLDL